MTTGPQNDLDDARSAVIAARATVRDAMDAAAASEAIWWDLLVAKTPAYDLDDIVAIADALRSARGAKP